MNMDACGAPRQSGRGLPDVGLPPPDETQHGEVEQDGAGEDPHPILRGQAEQTPIAHEPIQHGADGVPGETIGLTVGPAAGQIP